MRTVLSSPRRLLSAGLAIVLGVAFVAATLVLTSTLDATVRATAAGSLRDAKAVVTRVDTDVPAPLTDETIAAIRSLPGVDHVRATVDVGVPQMTGGSFSYFALMTPPEPGELTRVTDGRLPIAPGEVAVNEVAADLRDWQVGDTVALGEDPVLEFTLTGIVDAGADSTSHPTIPHAFALAPDIERLTGLVGYTTLFVNGPGSQDDLAATLASAPALANSAIHTADEAAQAMIEGYTRGSEQLTTMLLAFGAVAVVVAGLVVTNTFAILVAQRTRQLALLRTVGATRGLVFRTVLLEAALLGLVASVVGLGVGILGVLALRPVLASAQLDASVLTVTARDVVVPLLVGVVLAVAAAIHPARQATRVAPLAALRPQAPATEVVPRPSLLGIALAVIGFALLGVGALVIPRWGLSAGLGVSVGILGGLLSVAGVLVLGRTWAPALARLLGRPLRAVGGVPAEVAAENAVRNPGRAAATAGALLVGVALVSMMTVGASVGQATIQADLDGEYPVDALIVGSPLSDAQVSAVAEQPDVAASTVVRTAMLTLADGQAITVTAFEPDAGATLRAEGYLTGLADGVLLVGRQTDLVDGQRVSLREHDQATPIEVTVRLNPTVERYYALTANTLASAVSEPELNVGVRLAEGADPVVAADRLGQALGAVGDPVFVNSAAVQRAEMQSLIDTVLLVVLGLLGVAVVIALVGIGNTLGLSVHERRQESGLLRALGLTRGQLRAALGWEALLLAGAATVLGLVLGAVYGLAGVAALIASETSIVIDLPWARLALIAAVALASGWVASVLPSLRAAKVPPAAALALGE